MTFYFLIISQKKMLKNQNFEEILRERAQFLLTKNNLLDFWISVEPEILQEISKIKTKENEFQRKEINKMKQNYACLISTNKNFLYSILLRFGNFNDTLFIIKDKNLCLEELFFKNFFISFNLLKSQNFSVSNRSYFRVKNFLKKIKKNINIS